MRRLVYLNTAKRDLGETAAYIATASGHRAVARSHVAKLRDGCRKLAILDGLLGTDRATLRPNLRSTPNGNYIIFFRYADDTVEIVNVLHASRDVRPFYDGG